VNGASPESILETLRALLEREFELPPESVTLDAHLVDDLDLDSVDAVSLAALLEEQVGVSLQPEDVRSLDTVASVVEVLAAHLRESAVERS
jgi:acyl carrier protein